MSELTYGWNLEMQIKAAHHGLRIREIPVDYRRRLGGISKVSGDLRASAKPPLASSRSSSESASAAEKPKPALDKTRPPEPPPVAQKPVFGLDRGYFGWTSIWT